MTIATTGTSVARTNPDGSAKVLDTVITLVTPDVTVLDCNDDGPEVGGSSIPIELQAGTYYVQVGGYNYSSAPVGPDRGYFTISVSYAQDFDLDDDGYPGGQDCVDSNIGIHPNALDVEFNGIDEDCVGGDDRDGDDDNYSIDVDCKDDNSAINPGVREVPGDFEDENCDKEASSAALDPFPTVLFPNLAYRKRTLVKRLQIKDARRGYLVRVRCEGGQKRGCPSAIRRRLKSSRSVTIGYKKRFLRPGAEIRIYVTQPATNTVGKFVRFKIRRGVSAKRTDCRLVPGEDKPTRCGR